jgi:hypothetical protein
VGERKHDIATEYRSKTTVVQGLFLVLVGRAPALVWDVSAKHHIERKTPIPYVNHYSFHILDPEWGGWRWAGVGEIPDSHRWFRPRK